MALTTNIWYGEETVNDKEYCVQAKSFFVDAINMYMTKETYRNTVVETDGKLPETLIAVFRKKQPAA